MAMHELVTNASQPAAVRTLKVAWRLSGWSARRARVPHFDVDSI